MAARYPYSPNAMGAGEPFMSPLLPLELWIGDGRPIITVGLLDSGASVNVMPYGIGIQLGANWEAQKTEVRLSGNLAMHEARALIVDAKVDKLAPVRLVFAWSRAENIPLLLGHVNFFERFDICFHAARLQFEIGASGEV